MADKEIHHLNDEMAKVWDKLRETNTFVDATIVTSDGGSFPVHRAILAGYSKFFRALFSNNQLTDDVHRVTLNNVSSDEIDVLLNYMYCLQLNITEQNVTKLLHASDYLGILDVHQKCIAFLRDSLNPKNCLTIKYFARIPHEVMFAIGGWSGGSPTSAIESYDTRADRWIRVNEVDPNGPRAYHGTAVIGFDIYIIGGFDGMENYNSCRCFNAVTKTWREIAPMHERRCYVSVVVLGDTIYAMGGYNGHHRQNTAEKYDYRTNQWTTIAPMHVQRSDASAAVLNGKVYIVGGFDGRECLSTAEVYDPETNVWTVLPNMRSRRSGVSCIAYHDTICVLGGFNGVSRMSTVERYTPSTNQWTPLPDMYTTRSNFAVEVIDDMVFAIGGFNGVATIHQVECFDDRTNEWYEATDMNVFRSALSACVMSDLPNINDYIHQNRHMLMEEKRQRLLVQSQNNAAAVENNPAVINITQAIQEVNNAVGMEVDADSASEDEGAAVVEAVQDGDMEDEDL